MNRGRVLGGVFCARALAASILAARSWALLFGRGAMAGAPKLLSLRFRAGGAATGDELGTGSDGTRLILGGAEDGPAAGADGTRFMGVTGAGARTD